MYSGMTNEAKTKPVLITIKANRLLGRRTKILLGTTPTFFSAENLVFKRPNVRGLVGL